MCVLYAGQFSCDWMTEEWAEQTLSHQAVTTGLRQIRQFQ